MPSIFDNLFTAIGMKGATGMLGDDLRSQVTDETDELKKRRQLALGAVTSMLGSSFKGMGSVTQTLGGYTAGGLSGLRGG